MQRGECARTTETEVLVAFFVAFALVDVRDEIPDAPDVAIRRLCLKSKQTSVGRFRCFDEPAKASLVEFDPARQAASVVHVANRTCCADPGRAGAAPDFAQARTDERLEVDAQAPRIVRAGSPAAEHDRREDVVAEGLIGPEGRVIYGKWLDSWPRTRSTGSLQVA